VINARAHVVVITLEEAQRSNDNMHGRNFVLLFFFENRDLGLTLCENEAWL
jgi:hypothetical protein